MNLRLHIFKISSSHARCSETYTGIEPTQRLSYMYYISEIHFLNITIC